MKPTQIQLPFWQDPQFHTMVVFQRDTALVYFKCWAEENGKTILDTNIIGQLTFLKAEAIHIENRVQKLNSTFEFEDIYRASVIELKESEMLLDYFKKRAINRESIDELSYRHYIVNSHHSNIHIIAKEMIVAELNSEEITINWIAD